MVPEWWAGSRGAFEVLAYVVARRGGQPDQLRFGAFDDEVGRRLLDVLTDELTAVGLDERDEPNAAGHVVEDLIDQVTGSLERQAGTGRSGSGGGRLRPDGFEVTVQFRPFAGREKKLHRALVEELAARSGEPARELRRLDARELLTDLLHLVVSELGETLDHTLDTTMTARSGRGVRDG